MEAIPLIVLAVIILVWLSILSYFFWRLQTMLQSITRGGKKETMIDLLNSVLDKEKKLELGLRDTNRKVEGLLFDSQFYIQKIGLVRFNPFNDTGGDQSFILALVDDKDSGVVISGLHTRNGTRWYAKKVKHAKGVEHELSSDEVKAVKAATSRSKEK